MVARKASPALRWLVFAGVVIFSADQRLPEPGMGLPNIGPDRLDPIKWLRAAELEPSNADNWYRLYSLSVPRPEPGSAAGHLLLQASDCN